MRGSTWRWLLEGRPEGSPLTPQPCGAARRVASPGRRTRSRPQAGTGVSGLVFWLRDRRASPTPPSRKRPARSRLAPRVHLLGAGGAGVSAIGLLLEARGHQVTGHDAAGGPFVSPAGPGSGASRSAPVAPRTCRPTPRSSCGRLPFRGTIPRCWPTEARGLPVLRCCKQARPADHRPCRGAGGRRDAREDEHHLAAVRGAARTRPGLPGPARVRGPGRRSAPRSGSQRGRAGSRRAAWPSRPREYDRTFLEPQPSGRDRDQPRGGPPRLLRHARQPPRGLRSLRRQDPPDGTAGPRGRCARLPRGGRALRDLAPGARVRLEPARGGSRSLPHRGSRPRLVDPDRPPPATSAASMPTTLPSPSRSPWACARAASPRPAAPSCTRGRARSRALPRERARRLRALGDPGGHPRRARLRAPPDRGPRGRWEAARRVFLDRRSACSFSRRPADRALPARIHRVPARADRVVVADVYGARRHIDRVTAGAFEIVQGLKRAGLDAVLGGPAGATAAFTEGLQAPRRSAFRGAGPRRGRHRLHPSDPTLAHIGRLERRHDTCPARGPRARAAGRPHQHAGGGSVAEWLLEPADPATCGTPSARPASGASSRASSAAAPTSSSLMACCRAS